MGVRVKWQGVGVVVERVGVEVYWVVVGVYGSGDPRLNQNLL